MKQGIEVLARKFEKVRKEKAVKENWELYLALVANPHGKPGEWYEWLERIERHFAPVSNKPTKDILNDYKRIKEADKAS